MLSPGQLVNIHLHIAPTLNNLVKFTTPHSTPLPAHLAYNLSFIVDERLIHCLSKSQNRLQQVQ